MRFSEAQVLASLCKDSFYDFFLEFWQVIVGEKFVENWHIKFLCDELQEVAERVFAGKPKEYDLVINVPPGSSKSTICSQMFPAWCWARMPSAKFICASYAHAVALKDSLKTRDLILSEKYQRTFPITLREDENTKGLFTNDKTGFRLSAGVGGSVTGYHAHFLIVDDPINPKEALSEAELTTTNRWMQDTLPTRKVDQKITPTILIQQRLHQGDPSGEMIARDGVKHISLPGELVLKDGSYGVSPPECIPFYKDGLLDPNRFSREVMKALEKSLGPYGYASQVLQSPVPVGGGSFKVECLKMRDDVERKLVRVVRSWDKAGTEGGGAWSVGAKLGEDVKGFYWILDIVRGQWDSTVREEMIRKTAEVDGDEVEVVLEIEGGSGGKESGKSTVKNLAGFVVFTYHPTGDKETRAYPLSTQVGAGNVYCLNRPWVKDLKEEMKYFPKSKYKDQVDALSGAFNRLAKREVRVGAL